MPKGNRRWKNNKSLIHNYIYNIAYQLLILVLPLITTPYISRALGPDGVGKYGRTNSITQYFILIGCIGLNLYGQREIAYYQDNKEERSVIFAELAAVRCVCMLISIGTFLLTACQSEKYGILYRIEILEILAALIDITWFFQGLEEFKRIVIRNSLVKILGVVCILNFVKTSSDTPVYTAILSLAVFIGNLSLWIYIPKYVGKFDKKRLRFKRHIRPAFLLFIPQVATSVYNVLDKSMIALITQNDAEVAYYEQAQKVIKMALAIPTAVGTVMLPRIASMHGAGKDGQIKDYLDISMRFVCMVSFPLCFGVIGIAKDFVPWFFGPGYEKVYHNFLVIAPIIVCVGMSNVLGVQYLLPMGRQNDYTKSVITGTVVNFVCNAVLIPRFLSIGAAIGSVIAEISVTVTQLIILKREFSIREIFCGIYKYCIGGIIMETAILLYSGNAGVQGAEATIAEVMIGVFVYGIYLIIIRDNLVVGQIHKLVNRLSIRK